MQKQEIQPWDDRCPVYQLFDLLGKKWTFFILSCISQNINSFSGIMKRLPKINSKVLSERIDLLIEKGLIIREVSNNKPLRINYSLSEKWKLLEAKLQILADFALEEEK